MTIELNLKIHKSVYHSEKVLFLIFFFFPFFFLQILKPMGKFAASCEVNSFSEGFDGSRSVEVGRVNGFSEVKRVSHVERFMTAQTFFFPILNQLTLLNMRRGLHAPQLK